jgi:hypothetical protein
VALRPVRVVVVALLRRHVPAVPRVALVVQVATAKLKRPPGTNPACWIQPCRLWSSPSSAACGAVPAPAFCGAVPAPACWIQPCFLWSRPSSLPCGANCVAPGLGLCFHCKDLTISPHPTAHEHDTNFRLIHPTRWLLTTSWFVWQASKHPAPLGCGRDGVSMRAVATLEDQPFG